MLVLAIYLSIYESTSAQIPAAKLLVGGTGHGPLAKANMPPKNAQPVFVKQIPTFLAQYSHLLNAPNRKNYLGERTDVEDDTPDDFRDKAEAEALKEYEEQQDKDKEKDSHVDGERPFSYNSEVGVSKEAEDPPIEPELVGSKCIFKKKVHAIEDTAKDDEKSKRQRLEKKPEAKKKKLSMLSFADGEEEG